MKSSIINHIESAKVVAIIRLDDTNAVRPVIKALIESGISVLEITSNTPSFCEHITWARQNYPDTLIGAGTVITPALAQEAIQAGAQFLVTPNTDIEILKAAQNAGVVTLMGAMTPTEVAVAVTNGADFVKVFPAGPLGIDYFKALLGPFKGTRFLAVGSVNTANVAEWLKAGAVGVGVGGSFTSGTQEHIKEKVTGLLAQIKQAAP